MVQFRTLIPFLLLLVLAGCEERAIFKNSYEQLVVSRFRVFHTSHYEPSGDLQPNSLVVRVSGKVDQDVSLTLYRRGERVTDTTAIWEPLLVKGGVEYKNQEFRTDYYAPDRLILMLQPSSVNTTGTLKVEWGLF